MTLPSLLLVLSTLVLSTEARIPKHSNFKRSTATAAHTNQRGELELSQFDTLDTCVEVSLAFLPSLHAHSHSQTCTDPLSRLPSSS